MDKDFIAFLAIGIVAIGMAVFGKYRPEVVFRNYKGVIASDKQRFLFFTLLIYGIMFILIGIATCFPQFHAVKSALAITIAVVATVVMLFVLWKTLLSQDESRGRIAFAIVMLLTFAMIALVVYYWYVTLK